MNQQLTPVERREVAEAILGRKMKALCLKEGHVKGRPADRNNGPGWDRDLTDKIYSVLTDDWWHQSQVRKFANTMSNRVPAILAELAEKGLVERELRVIPRRGEIYMYRRKQ